MSPKIEIDISIQIFPACLRPIPQRTHNITLQFLSPLWTNQGTQISMTSNWRQWDTSERCQDKFSTLSLGALSFTLTCTWRGSGSSIGISLTEASSAGTLWSLPIAGIMACIISLGMADLAAASVLMVLFTFCFFGCLVGNGNSL